VPVRLAPRNRGARTGGLARKGGGLVSVQRIDTLRQRVAELDHA
jgi:hypothetical protein